MYLIIIAICLVLSLVFNAYLYSQIKKKPENKTLDQNAQDLLAEILQGPAVVKIEVIDRGSLLQWRPRN